MKIVTQIGDTAIAEIKDKSGYSTEDKYGVIINYDEEKEYDIGIDCDFTMPTYKEAVFVANKWG